jgi:hypothetical protein
MNFSKQSGYKNSVVELKLFFRSGSGSSSDFQKVSALASAPAPEPPPAPTCSFVSTFYHRFHVKKWIFHVFYDRISNVPNSHAGFYTM